MASKKKNDKVYGIYLRYFHMAIVLQSTKIERDVEDHIIPK